MKPLKIDAIIALDSDAKVIVRNDTDVEWLDSNPNSISEEAIQAKLKELQADYDSKQYQRDRIYPNIGDQLDMIYWDKINGTEKWKEAIEKVKSDHPKPE